MSPPARTSASSRRNSVGREDQRRLADARLVAGRLQHELPGRRAARRPVRRARPIDAAHDGRDPGQQLGLAERLVEVVVGADAERLDLGRLGALARHDEDRRLARRPGSGRRRVNPSGPGIARSSRTRSGCSSRKRLTAVRPS